MPTISDVAKAAGVSVATVSRVINNTGKVLPDTVERVMQAIEQLQYVPNVMARNLRRNESRIVIVVSRNFTNPFYARVLKGINDTAQEAGYTVLTCSNNGDAEQSLPYCRMLENHQADGIIILNYTEADEWIQPYVGKYPVVQSCEYHPKLNVPRVIVDHEKTGYDSTKYLMSLGHRKIGMITADNLHASTLKRMKGYRRALDEANIQFRDQYVAYTDGDYSFESSRKAALALLEQNDRPTAVVCVSDIVALSVNLVAAELGIRVPDELSVMGCDDIEYTTMMHPFLSTVRLPSHEFGKEAMRVLLNSIEKLPESCEEIILPQSLQIRESTGPAPE